MSARHGHSFGADIAGILLWLFGGKQGGPRERRMDKEILIILVQVLEWRAGLR